jgi:hypothetical protein
VAPAGVGPWIGCRVAAGGLGQMEGGRCCEPGRGAVVPLRWKAARDPGSRAVGLRYGWDCGTRGETEKSRTDELKLKRAGPIITRAVAQSRGGTG